MHAKSQLAYVGSTDDLYVRRLNHENALKANKHHNRLIQAAYNDDPNIQFKAIITETREEAYDYEQDILNRYFETGLLFNLACNARVFGKGLKRSIEHNKKISKAGSGKKHEYIPTAEQRYGMGSANRGKKLSTDTTDKMRLSTGTKSKPLSANGVIYPSLKAAARKLGLSKSAIKNRCLNKAEYFKDYFFI